MIIFNSYVGHYQRYLRIIHPLLIILICTNFLLTNWGPILHLKIANVAGF